MNKLNKIIKRYSKMHLLFIIGVSFLSSVYLGSLDTSNVSAQSSILNNWDPGRIIDDAIFTDNDSMSAQQIQSFLNGKVTSCDTNGQLDSEYGGPDLNGDGRVQRWEWGQANYGQTEFICLKNYVQDGKTAAQIIYDAAQEFSINPKVLVVLLQKEQALVTDTWPLNIQYRAATGYACPDTAACDSQYYGFKNQVRWAARMFRAIMNDSPTWFTPYIVGNNYIQYNPVSSCGGSTVNIVNRSTQALYNYTPYQPNQAALNAGWGTATCGAYGNRNFFLYFNTWFGSTVGNPVYESSTVSYKLYSDVNRLNEISTVEPNSTFYVTVTVNNSGNQTWYEGNTVRLGTESPRDRDSEFYHPSWINNRRPTNMSESATQTGQNATFNFTAKAPNNLGSYEEPFSLVMEGQRWIQGIHTVNIPVASSVDHYAGEIIDYKIFRDPELTLELNKLDSRVYGDSSIYVRTTVLNRGNQPLPASLTRLGTSGPRDRSSDFYDISWINDRRTAGTTADIPVDSQGYIVSKLKAPNVNGSYIERFGLVYDGAKWLEENKFSIPIKVYEKNKIGILKGYSIKKGQEIKVPVSNYTLRMQYDGNLVIYNSDNRAVWATGTNRSNGDTLRMQYDGNLVIYNSDNRAVWATGTNR